MDGFGETASSDGIRETASSSVAIASPSLSSILSLAFVDMPLPKLRELGAAVRLWLGDVGGEVTPTTRFGTAGRDPTSPPPPPAFAVTHAAASASLPKDLCSAPFMPVTCFDASSHDAYTPGS